VTPAQARAVDLATADTRQVQHPVTSDRDRVREAPFVVASEAEADVRQVRVEGEAGALAASDSEVAEVALARSVDHVRTPAFEQADAGVWIYGDPDLKAVLDLVCVFEVFDVNGKQSLTSVSVVSRVAESVVSLRTHGLLPVCSRLRNATEIKHSVNQRY